MKIAINTENIELYNAFYHILKDTEHQIINVKVESVLFENIENGCIDAYILSNNTPYFKKAIDFIKKNNPFTPVIAVMIKSTEVPPLVDICTALYDSFANFAKNTVFNVLSYVKTFETLQKLTAKMHEPISFANCIYDPTRRILSYKGKEVKKLSQKEGGILEVLALNYGIVVKKEIILEKVWHKTDYFAGRSCDVYITYLRNTLKEKDIKLTIINISGIGLILE